MVIELKRSQSRWAPTPDGWFGTITISTNEEIHTLAYAPRAARKMQDCEWAYELKKVVKSQALKNYLELGLEPTTKAKSMPEMAINKEALGWLIAARSGHCQFANYHEMSEDEEENIYCKCGLRRLKSHRFSCPSVRALRVC